jgi:hypothetical protein
VQLASTAYIAICRPFKQVKDSVIEINNQIIYLTACALLIHFNKEEKWNSSITNCYVYLIISMPIINAVISLVDLIAKISKKIKSCVSKDNKVVCKIKVKANNLVAVSLPTESKYTT